MTREEYDAIFYAYLKKFGQPLVGPPLDLGIGYISLEQEAAYMKAAIESGEPVDWYKIFTRLPEGYSS